MKGRRVPPKPPVVVPPAPDPLTRAKLAALITMFGQPMVPTNQELNELRRMTEPTPAERGELDRYQ